MRKKIINEVSSKTSISSKQIDITLKLLEDGNTVPFIARYRKEQTGNLDEDQIFEVNKVYSYYLKLEEKKKSTIKKIDEKGMLTEELVKAIQNAEIISEVDDIYLPFKEKKKTKASAAIKAGIEPLVKYIYNDQTKINEEAQKYITEGYEYVDSVIEGAKHIIAEKISDNSDYRKLIRDSVFKNGSITSKLKKGKEEIDEFGKFENYYDFSQAVMKIPSYRYLAIARGEKEKILTVSIDFDNEYVISKILDKEISVNNIQNNIQILSESIDDAYKRLVFPSITREIRSVLKERSDLSAINIFSKNFEKLIMQKPLKNKWILGIDPAFRTGCKLAVIDNKADMVEIGVIYPHEPVNKVVESQKEIIRIVKEYPIEQIVIGNGTASRETETFIRNMNLGINHNLISEAGASVYSASKVAQEEFPDLQVEYRSAISIARRVQDPMAELVKIDPKSIGVGQYQHDVDQKELSNSLDFTTQKIVNQVGVDLNTASKELLMYVSGLDKSLAKNIIQYRLESGKFKNRKNLLDVKRLGNTAYKQCAGFLKILDGDNYLDETFIHPEDYKVAQKLLEHYEDIKESGFELSTSELTNFASDAKVSETKVKELIDYLQKPNLDIRDNIVTAEFKSNITNIDDLNIGDKVQGEVRNILEFGAFVDIGLKNDALIHISQISNSFVKSVSDYLDVGDIKEFKILDIDTKSGKIKITLKD